MASIREIGPNQIRVEIRRKGVKVPARTFETWTEARDWATKTEGRILGNEYVAPATAQGTTLKQAIEWYEKAVLPRTPASAINKRTYAAYWKASDFASWRMNAVMPWDLRDWRIAVLDEDNAEDDTLVGPAARWSKQTCWHYLQFISHLFTTWCDENKVRLPNPVSNNVRPILDNARDRRLDDQTDTAGRTEEDRLFAVVDASTSPWLGAATRIALETCMRQTELATLEWSRTRLDGDAPYADLPKTKNDRARRVPLSTRAVAAFRTLEKLFGEKKRPTVLGIETGSGIGQAFRAVVTDEAFPDLRWHDLRHEAISRLFERTDLRDHEIMAITGHLSHAALKRYTHLRAARLASRLG